MPTRFAVPVLLMAALGFTGPCWTAAPDTSDEISGLGAADSEDREDVTARVATPVGEIEIGSAGPRGPGSATRSLPCCYEPGVTFTVRISIDTPPGTIAMGAEDCPPDGWTNITNISDGGLYDPVFHKVKWGPYFAPSIPTELTYDITPPLDAEGLQCFPCGTASFDGINQDVQGDICFNGCAAPMIVSSDPSDGYIDPRQDLQSDCTTRDGIAELSITFSEPVRSQTGGVLEAADFQVTVTGGDVPQVVSVDASLMPIVTLTFGAPIPPGQWTSIVCLVENDCGWDIDTANDAHMIDIGFAPGDVNQNRIAFDLQDAARFNQIKNDLYGVPDKCLFIDMNRDGVCSNVDDQTRFMQLKNGICATRVWAGYQLGPKPHGQP